MALDPELEEIYRKNVKALMDNISQIKVEFEKKNTLAQSVELATEEKQNAYTLGYQFYQQQKYDKALIIFNALHLLDPLNKEFAKAQAATMQMQGKFDDAALNFLITYFFHTECLEFALYAGRCMVEAKEFTQAYFILKNILAERRFPNSDENKKSEAIIRELVPSLLRRAEEEQSSRSGGRSPSADQDIKTGAPVTAGTKS
ncbi:MAG: tetratricopeptide repeat protein [Puniceicoccales bacterium]|jgi:tetratricopeptide (TPR) repeat protein|nr:tetratricopeptide repeat protein [Puniceicoccales bacterium]